MARRLEALGDLVGALGEHRQPFQVLARVRRELARAIDGREGREVVFQPRLVVVLAVARRGVDEARAALGRDVVAAHDDLRVAAERRVRHGSLVRRARERLALKRSFNGKTVAELLAQRLDERLGHHERPAAALDDRVRQVAVDGDREVRGQRPGRRRPDRELDVPVGNSRERGRRRRDVERRVDGRRRVAVGVLELRLR
mmetsp:Transcript_11583/g.35703  ORF Transcript_11583/g.35703 Transcript_11583/m.35703 type:complete len:200 (-) Transcript_11583:690-1289(-)